MENMSEDRGKNMAKKPSDHICIGLLAHVDAGKTTLSESMLYLSGRIRQQGRVDHGNAYLDTYELERERGITIFSKQAELVSGELQITLLDTPGHVDFSAEMERTLRVLDYAILVDQWGGRCARTYGDVVEAFKAVSDPGVFVRQ